MSQIESTYKARDVEEFLDLYFYRPVGYLIARVSQRLGVTPNVITIVSIFIGVTAGHLFYYRDLLVNVLGMLLFVLADAMDSADGQLARMTDTRSRFGRILDGFGGNLMFASMYIHFCFRILHTGGPWWIFAVAVIAGASHSFQSAMADYYRNAYLYFVHGEEKSELDKSQAIAALYRRLSWQKNLVEKFFLRFYLNYTYQQESLARNFQKLFAETNSRYGSNLPTWFQQEYARKNKPLLKYYNILTTNTRISVMYACIILDVIPVYFVFEIVVLNMLLAGVTIYQERLNFRFLQQLAATGE
jgi:phosphatidylglycerophosphate synthase